MARRRNLESISTPIILGGVSIVLSVALLVGWTVLIASQLGEGTTVTVGVWLLVLGTISFAVIVTVLVLFSVYLAREILEVRRQDSFIDSVTHELKSPLASLRLCLETMARHDLPEDKRESLQEMMLDDVDRLTSFIDDVLQASRLAGQHPSMNATEVRLRDHVRTLADAIAARHRIAPESIVVEVPETMCVVTDEAALSIILKNLIDNALKYSDAQPTVHVRSSRDSRGRAVIEVRDRGIGIAPADLKRVFHRFYRVPRTDVRGRKGTGLGLFVVWALVKNLGGKVQALSDGVGHGTTLRVVLPPNDEVEAEVEAEATLA